MTARDMVMKLKDEKEERDEALGRSLLGLALRRLRRDNLTLMAMAVIAVITLSAIFAPQITGVLDINYSRTDGPNAFIPVGGQDRLTVDTDYRFRPRTVSTAVVYDYRAKAKSKVIDTNFNDLQEGNAGLKLFNAALLGKGLDIYVTGGDEAGTSPSARSIKVGEGSPLIQLPPGTYTLTLRESTGSKEAPPTLVLPDVEVKAGWLTMSVAAGGGDSGLPLELKLYPTDLATIGLTEARLQLIQVSPDSPPLNVLLGNDNLIAQDISYEEEILYDMPRQTTTLGTSPVDARRRVLGTDDLGRDQLARLLYGGQVSLGIAFLA
ncbi:MAG TPA: DUF4397 domain-containing protein, partial [Aggregatilineales bacterium]|nr:DUF4397 domain-containing protein [Aggregatilineales bacterium]